MSHFLDNFREREHITPLQLCCLGLICAAIITFSACSKPLDRNSVLRFKGKTYVIAGLQGAGYTRENRSPVYSVIVMSEEDVKKWTKK